MGIREVEDQIWLVSFLDYDLAFFDKDEGRVEPAPNPFVPDKVLPLSPAWTPSKMARPERFELPTFWFVARHSIQLSYGRG